MPHRIKEFHNIMPIQNIPSVISSGILSYERAADVSHGDCSMAEIQDKRDNVEIPNGLKLHQYANLYFDARNPMMSKRRGQAESLCILSISIQVLQCKGVVLTDRNASSEYVRFYQAQDVSKLPLDQIYLEDWTHVDQYTYWRQKSHKCAEVLVPFEVPYIYIRGAYVVDEATQINLFNSGFKKKIKISPNLFFR